MLSPLRLVLAVLAAAFVASASVLEFAVVQDVSSAAKQGLVAEAFGGLMAAAKEINDKSLLGPTVSVRFSFVAEPGPGASSSAREAFALSVLTNASFIGLVLPGWSSSDVLIQTALKNNISVPIVAPRTLLFNSFTPAAPFVLHSRPPVEAVIRAMLNYALHSSAVHLVTFALVVRSDNGARVDIANTLWKALTDLGLDPPKVVVVNVSNGFNATAVCDEWVGDGSAVPGVVMAFLQAAEVEALAVAAWSDARIQNDWTTILSSNLGNPIAFGKQLNTSALAAFRNVRGIQFFPDPSDASLSSSSAYAAALNSWLGTGASLPTEFGSATVTAAPNYLSFEGYVAGMLLLNMLRAREGDTPAGLLSGVYRQRYFNVQEIMFGPYTSGCLNGTTQVDFPCFCNAGGKSTYISVVDTKTGLVKPTPLIESGISVATAPLQLSGLTVSSLAYPVGIFIVTPPVLPASDMTTGTVFLSGLAAVSSYINAKSPSFGRYSVVLLNTYDGAHSDDWYLNNVRQRFRPYIVTGDYINNVTGPSVYFFSGVKNSITSPAIKAATAYSHYWFDFLPSVADIAHSLASFADQLYPEGSVRPVVRIGASETETYDVCLKSLHTFQFDPEPGWRGAASVDIASMLEWGLNSAETRETVLMIGTINRAFLMSVIETYVGLSAGRTAATVRRLLILLPVSHFFVYSAKNASYGKLLRTEARVVFSTYLPPFWMPDTAVYQSMQMILNSDNGTQIELLEHPGRLRGYILGRIVQEVTMNFKRTDSSAEAFIDSIYKLQTISIDGIPFGPFYKANCSSEVVARGDVDRVCQCSRGMRKFWALDYMDWVERTYVRTNGYSWVMTTCGVKYAALRVTTPLNVGLIVAIAVPLGTAVLLAFVVMKLCSGRSNRTAPKDPDAPFAVVFTDIQSSTALWARCPTVMGDCVETHHFEIRKLIRKHDGYEVKTIGDSFMVGFKRATDATNFALGIQSVFYHLPWPEEVDDTYRDLALEKAAEVSLKESYVPETLELYDQMWHGIRVRVGLNWGMGSVKFDPVSQGYDYYGTLVNTAARVEGVGNGGQVLITKEMHDELERVGYNFSAIDISPLGPQPLRGLDAPIPLYQLSPMELKCRRFAPLRLDVEIDEEELSDATGAGTETTSLFSDRSGKTATGELSIEQAAEKLLSRGHAAYPGAVDMLSKATKIFEALLSTSTASFRSQTLKQLMSKWHIQLKGGKKEAGPPELVALVHKAVLVVDEQKKSAHRRASMRSDVVSFNKTSENASRSFHHHHDQAVS